MSQVIFKPVPALSLCMAAVSGLFCTSALADPVRISVKQFSGDPQKVSALQTGISNMRAASSADQMSAQFRTSLAYWANTHGYLGTGTHATNMQSYVIDYRMPQCLGAYPKAVCDSYYKHLSNISVPNDGFTDSIWGTCQHSTPDAKNYFFLPWHRFYLHYFERTVRKQANDPAFSLPYWNYYDNYNAARKGLALPPLVQGEANTLYNQYRTPGLNANQQLMKPESASAKQAFIAPDFATFSSTLEGQPHGMMHCATGSQCTMPDIGFVPVAGTDPLFYMHHANIDRLWQCWMTKKANGQTIDLAWAKANLGMDDAWYEQSFKYVDENGQAVTVKVADVFSPAYSPQYDNLTNCDAGPAQQPSRLVASSLALASPLKAHPGLVAGKPVTLGNTAVNVALKAIPGANVSAVNATEQTATMHSYLVLENVQLQGAPGLTYNVLLSSKANPKKTSYIATFNYFGVGPMAHGGHQGGNPNALGTLVYQVSENLAELGITSASDASVRFEPTNLMVGAKLKMQKTGNGVTVGNIRLETAAQAPKQ